VRDTAARHAQASALKEMPSIAITSTLRRNPEASHLCRMGDAVFWGVRVAVASVRVDPAAVSLEPRWKLAIGRDVRQWNPVITVCPSLTWLRRTAHPNEEPDALGTRFSDQPV
jgi:hypothetical protein